MVLHENVSQETAGLPRLVRSPFPGQQSPREVGPDHKSDVPCAEVRKSLSQLRVDGVPSAN